MKASVIGGGSWGSAFALHLGRLEIPTRLWIREEEICSELLKSGENKVFLPGFVFPPTVSFTSDIEEAVPSADFLFIAVPSSFCRPIYNLLSPLVKESQTVVSLTKGIEEASLKRMTEVMEEIFLGSRRPHLAVLSGPSFAREVAELHPTAVVVASREPDLAETIQHLISSLSFRAYASDDIVGVELAGALKNVIALATGISDALEFGHNTRAALITRGLAEITRLGLQLGAKKETFSGLAGIGDLVLTCTTRISRNYHVGFELGKGEPLDEILARMNMVAEGVTTTVSGVELARREKVEMPIAEEVYQILYERKNPKESLVDLMSRKLRVE